MLQVVTDINKFRLSRSPAFFTVHTDKADQPNVRVDVSVFHKQWNDVVKLLGTDSLTPDASGNCTFELSDYFSSVPKPGFTFPESGVFTIRDEVGARFIIQINEYYGNPPAPTSYLIIPDFYYAIPGKVPSWFQHKFYATWQSWQHKLSQGDLTMSFEHLHAVSGGSFSRLVSKQDIIKLFLQCNADYAALKLKIDFVFTDGSTGQTEYQSPTQFAVKQGQVLEISMGYNTLGIDSILAAGYPGNTLHSWSVTAMNHPSVVLSFPCKFHLDPQYRPYYRQFIFRNSAGGYDTLVTTGEAIANIDYDYEIVDTPFWPATAIALRKNIRIVAGESIKCNTGLISKSKLDYLPEFFASQEPYEILDGKLLPILFKPTGILRRRDAGGVYHVDFEYYHVEKLIIE